MSLAKQFAQFAVSASPNETVKEVARDAIPDCFGCIIAGASSEVAEHCSFNCANAELVAEAFVSYMKYILSQYVLVISDMQAHSLLARRSGADTPVVAGGFRCSSVNNGSRLNAKAAI